MAQSWQALDFVHMPLSPSTVANYFLDAGNRESVPLTPLKLQKLVYFAHGWYMGFTGEPLVHESIQAWEFGPVIPSLYHEFKEFKNNPITRYTCSFRPEDLTSSEMMAAKSLLDRIWSIYSRYTASQLSALSHEPNGPWHQMLGQMPDGHVRVRNMPIPNELIHHFFRARVEKN
jgi:uncharacterized phage-associated protein